MSTQSTPTGAGSVAYLLTVRGKVKGDDATAFAELHNQTAGSPEGVAGAQALGDLSHNVFVSTNGSADDLLFVDYWNSLEGLGQFFAAAQVQQGASALFAERDGTVWAPSEGFGDVAVGLPSGQAPLALGTLRVPVTSYADAATAFSAYSAATINTARRHGLVAHRTFTRVANPGEDVAPEVIGLDVWRDVAGARTYYDLGLGFDLMAPVFAGPPTTATWQSAGSHWTEW